MKEYIRMLMLGKRHWPSLLAGVICMLFSAIFDSVQLGMIVPLADKIFTQKKIVLPAGMPDFLNEYVQIINDLDPMYLFNMMILWIPVLFLFKAIFSYLQGIFMNMASNKTMMDTKNAIYAKYQCLSLDFYSKKKQGELVSRITNDVGGVGHAMSYALTDTIYQSFQIVLYSIIALSISAKLVMIIAVMFPFIGFVVLKIGKQLKAYSTSAQESAADMNTLLNETIQGVRIIKGFSREDHEIKRSEEINKRLYKLTMKGIRRTLFLPPLTEYIGVISIVVILFFAGRDVMSGELSFGVFCLFIGALMSIMRPVKKLSNVHGINQQALASSKRIYDILDIEPKILDKEDAQDMEQPSSCIEFSDVEFSYDSDDEIVLKKISHRFPVGQTTAIVGPTGCGKSTILNMIPRFYDPQSGVISIDDYNLKDLKVDSLRKNIGIVTQDMILFHESIRENLKYGKLDASDEEIIEACKKALAWEFIQKFPEGLDTIIGDRGFRLSGGQKQRLCIARAILRDPQILLLDEATSALDAESENLVQKALDNLMEDRTVLVVAHRLSTIKNASCILVMQDGKITQKGTHEELLLSSPLYKKLADLNFTS